MKHYIWFRTTNLALIVRCVHLFNKLCGLEMTYFRDAVDENDVGIGEYGCPVGAGPDAGNNPGCAALETWRSTILAGPHTNLTNLERIELIEFITASVPLHSGWFWDPTSPDYPGTPWIPV